MLRKLMLCLLFIFIARDGICPPPDHYMNSVVKIIALFKKGVASFSSGFIYYHPNMVVTTLHSVAGAQSITVYSEVTGSTFTAVPIRMIKDADLVLLQLDGDSKLPVLSSAAVSTNSTETFWIWGYPHDVATMQGDPINFSVSQNPNPTLTDIFGHELAFQPFIHELQSAGYPSLSVFIERIGSIIQPGHSGAPIFNSDGKVVGIADGGLGGGYQRVNWAIRSAAYLSSLNNSQSYLASLSKSPLTELYSVELDNIRNIYTAPKVVIKDAQGEKMAKTWTKSLSELVNSLPPGQIEDPLEALNHYQNDFHYDIKNTSIQVYENFETGFTLAIPAGGKFYFDIQTKCFVIEAGFVKEYYQMSSSNDFDALVAMNDAFDQTFEKLRIWTLPQGNYSEYTKRTGTYRIGRDLRSADGNIYLNIRGDVNGNSFNGEATIRDFNKRTNANQYVSYVMDVLNRINKSNLSKLPEK